MMKLIALFVLLPGHPAVAAPSHFSMAVGSAILCRSQVSAVYFNGYMASYFGKPAFTSGGANWWKVGSTLFGSQLEYVFVGTRRDFIGATFKDEPSKLIKHLNTMLGINYHQTSTEKWVSVGFGVLIVYHDKNAQSKMFCIGAPYSAAIT